MSVNKKDGLGDEHLEAEEGTSGDLRGAAVRVPEVVAIVPGGVPPDIAIEKSLGGTHEITVATRGQVDDVLPLDLADAQIEGVDDLLLAGVKNCEIFAGLDEEDLKAIASEAAFEHVMGGDKITDDMRRGVYIPSEEVAARLGGKKAVNLEKGKAYGVYVFVGLDKPTTEIELLGQGRFLKVPASAFTKLSPKGQRTVKLRVLGEGHQVVLNRRLVQTEQVLEFPNAMHEVSRDLADLMMRPDVMYSRKNFDEGVIINHAGAGKLGFVLKGSVSVRHPEGVGRSTEVAILHEGNFLGERAAAGHAQQAKMFANADDTEILWCNLNDELLDAALVHQAKKLRTSNEAVL